MKIGNKGYSLLELIISFAILSVVSVVVLGFMGTGANTYRSISSESALQYESQLTLGQLQEYLIDCSGGVCFDGDNDVLYVLNADDSGSTPAYTLHTFHLDGNEIDYNVQPVTIALDDSLNFDRLESMSFDLMSKNVTDFYVDFDYYFDGAVNIATKADVTISLSMGGRNYTGHQEIAFRNAVILDVTVESMADLVVSESEE